MGWKTRKLNELFDIGSSKRVLKSQWQKAGVPFYRGREITALAKCGSVENELFITQELYEEYAKKYGAPAAGDIVVTAIGTIGNTHIVRNGEKFYFKDASVLWLKKISQVDSEYVNYWFKSSLMKEQLDAGNGATVDTLTIKKLQSLNIYFPSLSEQKQIVAILDDAFANIDQARQLAERNLKNARELFDSTLNKIFTRSNDAWNTNNLKNLTTKIGSGATPRGGKDSYKDSGIPLIRSLNVHDRTFRNKDLAFLDDAQAAKLDNVIVQSGDVLLNITGASVARCCVAPDEHLPARVNQHVSIIRPKADQLLPVFLNYLLTSKHYKDQLLGIGEAGSTRQAITKAQIESFIFSYPVSLTEQKSIIEKVRLLQFETEKLELIYQQKIIALDELKQSFLQKAFRGELTQAQAAA